VQVAANFPPSDPDRQVTIRSQLSGTPPAHIAQPDLVACNAIIQVVDRFLLPSTVRFLLWLHLSGTA